MISGGAHCLVSALVPGALECVDGKHIPIVSPVEGKYAYVNRKNFRSINAQADARDFNMISQI